MRIGSRGKVRAVLGGRRGTEAHSPGEGVGTREGGGKSLGRRREDGVKRENTRGVKGHEEGTSPGTERSLSCYHCRVWKEVQGVRFPRCVSK